MLSIPDSGWKFSLPPKTCRATVGTNLSPVYWHQFSFSWRYSGWSVKLQYHLHLLLRLRMGVVICLFYVCCMSVVCLLYVCCMSVVCLLYVCCMSVVCLLYVCCMSVVCLLYVSCMSVVYLFPLYTLMTCTGHTVALLSGSA